MRVVVVYKEQTDYARQVLDYIADFKRQTGHDLEVINPESPAGIDFTQIYDIMELPVILAITDEGVFQNSWVGIPLPTISEVSYYVQ